MPNARFHTPVSIFVGLGFPREVDSVLEAYKVLTEWPVNSRGSAHALALKTCEAALAGRALVRPVREAFAAFAADRGVLAPQALETSVARAAGEWLPSEPAAQR